MHGLTGGSWKRSRHSATPTEKNNLTRNRVVPNGSVVYNRTTPPRQLPTLLRWGNSARKFSIIDSYVHRRLAALASNKEGRRGRNWKRRFTSSWIKSLGVHHLSGTVRYYGTAHA